VCTLSFRRDAHGYELFFSRDERRERAVAAAPRLQQIDGVRFLAPSDPEGGGTWLAANDCGVTLALLNRYGVAARGGEFESRGALVLGLASARTVDEVETRLRARDLARHRPFDLAAFAPGAPVTRFGWDGSELEIECAARAPFTSSAVADAEARTARRARFAALCGDEPASGNLERFHREHAPERGALSTCMHRADAKTVSLSRVQVTRDRVALAYAAGSPCQAAFGPALELARA
jgi:transport and Golgi organization protein 2